VILDSSAALSWAFIDERTSVSQALFIQAVQGKVEVPAIWPFEVANKLYLGLQKGRLTTSELDEAFAGFRLLDLQVHPPASLSLLTLSAQRFGLTAYDAAFVELALRLGQPLATLDQKMRASALATGVVVIP
jgi:predicted nucleic acid-binding protein